MKTYEHKLRRKAPSNIVRGTETTIDSVHELRLFIDSQFPPNKPLTECCKLLVRHAEFVFLSDIKSVLNRRTDTAGMETWFTVLSRRGVRRLQYNVNDDGTTATVEYPGEGT
jgi:hypothetical protein